MSANTLPSQPEVAIMPGAPIHAPLREAVFVEQTRPTIPEVANIYSINRGSEQSLPPNIAPLSRFDLNNVDQALTSVVQLGQRQIGIIRTTVDGKPSTGIVEICQRFPQYDMNHPIKMPRLLGWVEDSAPVRIDANVFPELGAGQNCTVRLQGGNVVIANDTDVKTDLITSNGVVSEHSPYEYMPWRIGQSKAIEHAQGLPAVPPAPASPTTPLSREVAPRQYPEFEVSGNRFKLLGKDPAGHWVVSSTDPNGVQRSFLVYQSRSEGSRRVSQGREAHNVTDIRLLKGPENSKNRQYTQDTQVHPDVLNALYKILDTQADEDAMPKNDSLAYVLSEQQANAASDDFEAQVQVMPLAPKVDPWLRWLNAEGLSKRAVQSKIAERGKRQDTPDTFWQREIKNLNDALAKADIIPDFTRPVYAGMADHPNLGPYALEVYQKTTKGQTIEWHIGRDSQGRVWIDRIRLAGSPATAYGTDQTMIYSGILTSKPLEYKEQCDGLPANLHRPTANPIYDDITPFLDQLLPIQRYRQTATMPRQKLFHAPGGINF